MRAEGVSRFRVEVKSQEGSPGQQLEGCLIQNKSRKREEGEVLRLDDAWDDVLFERNGCLASHLLPLLLAAFHPHPHRHMAARQMLRVI